MGNMKASFSYVKNVQDKLYRKLKTRVALEGMSLSDYLLGHIRKIAQRPTYTEMLERLQRRESFQFPIPPADLIRKKRGR